MTTAKVKIDTPSGLIELEGDKDFVSAYLDKLLPLVEAAGFGIRARTENSGGGANSDLGSAEPPVVNKEVADPPKKKRKVPKRPPAGASCRERIQILRGDGFFKEQRSPSDIVAGLSKKGWTHTPNQVSAALKIMFDNGEIQRTKAGDGPGFAYYWDRH